MIMLLASFFIIIIIKAIYHLLHTVFQKQHPLPLINPHRQVNTMLFLSKNSECKSPYGLRLLRAMVEQNANKAKAKLELHAIELRWWSMIAILCSSARHAARAKLRQRRTMVDPIIIKFWYLFFSFLFIYNLKYINIKK